MQDSKDVVRQCFQDGNLDALDAIISRDYVLHDPANPEDIRGVDGLKALVETSGTRIFDLQVTIDHQLGGGDYVATRFAAHGTQDGELMGVPATGREVTIAGITISRCRDAKIVEEWEVMDVFGLLRQIGPLPATVES